LLRTRQKQLKTLYDYRSGVGALSILNNYDVVKNLKYDQKPKG